MADEIKVVLEEKKEKFDVVNLFDPIEKVLNYQHGRVIKEFNINCEKSMRVVPVVTAILTIENYKLLKEIRNLLIDIRDKPQIEEEKKLRKPIK